MLGSVLDGRYRILGLLGQGGMGEVYLAEHIALGRKEALKVLKPDVAQDPAFISRFRREARATNRMQHPNIVTVHDFGKLPDGRFYLSTEYVDGQPLDSILRQLGRLPLSRTLDVLHQLADAVDHAHARGVIHRDLKPENMVLVEHRGRPDFLKVLDFGIAKIIAPGYQETAGITAQGEVFGTVEYMSPEQLSGEATDPRIDLYAIGCVAFELLVGEPPFLGRKMDVMHKHLTKAPGLPSERRPEARVPPALDALVARCLEKDAKRRFQTAKELMVAIERVPGFAERKPSSDKRRLETVHFSPADFALDEETHESSLPRPMPDASGATELLDGVAALERVIRELGQTLTDLGVRDIQFLMGLATLAQLEDDVRRAEDEMASITTRTDAHEQAARDRDGALRFTLGELAFERSQAVGRGERVPPELDAKIGQVEQRLASGAKALERELNEMTDRSIELAAERAKAEEEILSLLRTLAGLCAEHAPRFRGNQTVEALRLQLERLRGFLDGPRS